MGCYVMVEFKVVVSKSNGETTQEELVGDEAETLVGKKIGETVDASIIGEEGELRILGGSDEDGIPMRPGVDGQGRKRLLLEEGVGYNPKEKGEKRRKMVHGNTISQRIVQVNTKLEQ